MNAPGRRSPMLGQVLLLVGVLILAGVGVATVVVPELADESEDVPEAASPTDEASEPANSAPAG